MAWRFYKPAAVTPWDRITAVGYAVSLNFLFSAYLAFFASVAVTNSVHLPTLIMRWAVLPCYLICLMLLSIQPIERPLFDRLVLRTTRSVALWAAMAYLFFLILATQLRDDIPHFAAERFAGLIFRRSLDVMAFVVVTAHLVLLYRNFLRKFLIAATALLSINAFVNLAAFLELAVKNGVLETRLAAVFGTPKFTNATHVGPLWIIYALSTLGLAVSGGLRRNEKIIISIATLVLVFAALATQSRGVMVALAAGSIAIAITTPRRWRIMTAFAFATAAAIFFALDPLWDVLTNRGASFRLELWQTYLSMTFEQHPWIGFGLQRELWTSIRDNAFEQPHNSLIWAYVRGGIGAAAAFILMLCSVIYWTFRHWRRTGNLAPVIAIMALVITAVTEIGFLPWSANWLWITFWLPIGLGAGIELKETAFSMDQSRDQIVKQALLKNRSNVNS